MCFACYIFTFRASQDTGPCRSLMKGCSKGIVLCQVLRDSFFCIPSWRGICQRKWWFSSLHVTRWSTIQNFSDTFKWIALIFMGSKSSRSGHPPSLTSVKPRKASCYVLMLLLVVLTFPMWYVSCILVTKALERGVINLTMVSRFFISFCMPVITMNTSAPFILKEKILLPW